jgi:sulfate adenylyltransferase
MNRARIRINQRQYLELEKLALGAFAPLDGFMREAEFASVVEQMRLPNGQPFPLPILLDLDETQALEARRADVLCLIFEGVEVGEVSPESVFGCNKGCIAEKLFGTRDERHPGVAHFLRMGKVFVGGPARLTRRVAFDFSDHELTPDATRAFFAERGWKTIVGFQTRNVPHRAHEYLLRLALEFADGLFVQPLVGQKKHGDCTPAAILAAYRTLIDGFLPRDRILLGVLSTAMRYAGPREAIFHAIIRRNYGCTHFIVGRDHAGVGDYYGKYEAQESALRFNGELGIQILPFAGPYHCARCGSIVTERTCPHGITQPNATTEISGTAVRNHLHTGRTCPQTWIRPEVLQSLEAIPVFIDEDDE